MKWEGCVKECMYLTVYFNSIWMENVRKKTNIEPPWQLSIITIQIQIGIDSIEKWRRQKNCFFFILFCFLFLFILRLGSFGRFMAYSSHIIFMAVEHPNLVSKFFDWQNNSLHTYCDLLKIFFISFISTFFSLQWKHFYSEQVSAIYGQCCTEI